MFRKNTFLASDSKTRALKQYYTADSNHRSSVVLLFFQQKHYIKCICCGLRVCVPLQFTCWNPMPQWDGIRTWTWGLWEVIKSKGWGSHVEVSALLKGDRRELASSISSLTHVRAQQEDDHLQTRQRALTRNLKNQHLDLGLPRLQN